MDLLSDGTELIKERHVDLYRASLRLHIVVIIPSNMLRA
jgi:hypothetical protein